MFDSTVHREIVEVADWLRQDAHTRAVVFGGTGDVFCTDIDTPSFRKGSWQDVWVEGRRGLGGLLDIEVPVIGVVNGPARIHAELVVIADVVLACPEATFADHAHFTKGIVPGDGVQTVWPRLLGPTRGSYFLLTGQELSAEEAMRLGVVHEIHPRDRLYARALELGSGMARLPVETLMYTRMLLRSEDRRLFGENVSHGLALAGLDMYLTGKRFTSPAPPDKEKSP